MDGCFACVCVSALPMCLVPLMTQKNSLGSLQLELHMVVSCHVGAEN